LWNPILKIPNTKKGWQSGSSGRPLPSKHRPWVQTTVPTKKKGNLFCKFDMLTK
jgi:hypothetical protein